MAIFKGGKGRDDTFVGGTKADRFEFDPLDLNSGDTIVGGSGRAVDVLRFTAPGAIGASALAHVSGIERIELAGGGASSLVLTNELVASANGGRVQVVGGSGDDFVYATDLYDGSAIDFVSNGGTDYVFGGEGDDTFTFDVAALDEHDRVEGDKGFNTLVLTGTGSVSASQLSGMTALGAITLGDGGIAITLTDTPARDSDVANLAVIGGAGADTLDATQAYSTPMVLLGGAGDDVIVGGPAGAFADGGAGADTVVLTSGTAVYDADDLRIKATQGTLIVRDAATIDLRDGEDITAGDTVVVSGFQNVDASEAKETVTITGLVYSTLIGGSGQDTLIGGSYLRGGAGADTLIGSSTTYSVTFDLLQGDFARGEVIRGGGSFDTLRVTSSVNLRAGTVEGIDQLVVYADGHDTNVTMSGAQFASIRSVNGSFTADHAATVHVEFGRHDVVSTGVSSYGANLDLQFSAKNDTIGPFYGNVVVHGGGGDDTIASTGQVFGEDGDDTISGYPTALLADGGAGSDTLKFSGYASALVVIDLSARQQAVSGAGSITGFENIDGRELQYGGLTVTGSSGDNVLYGTFTADTLSGGRGNDVLSGSIGFFDNEDVLDGGQGSDLLFGSSNDYSSVTMTGGGGADRFRWATRSNGDVDYDRLDIVTDFKPGHDTLEFAAGSKDGGFGFAGDFDTRVVASGLRTDITGADLVIVRGRSIDGISGVAAYLDSAAGGSDAGLFIAVENSAGHTILYYSESGTYGDDYYGGITAIADLGDIKPTQLQLSDFAFI